MALPAKPKFDKRDHHVVPVLWQRRFASPGDNGPYYLNVETGQTLSLVGPGKKMSEPYANIVFDEFYRPSDALEDTLATLESTVVQGLDSLDKTGVMEDAARVDIAMLMALQACRYPENFVNRMDLGKYLAIALSDVKSFPSAAVFNGMLRISGMLAGASITDAEFARLQCAPSGEFEAELDHILELHGYEAHFNPSLIIAAAPRVASHLLGLDWKLLKAPHPSFILSDRPVPTPTKYNFSIGLNASYGLVLSLPTKPVTEGAIHSQAATRKEIDEVNVEVRSRAREWICGPGNWVHKL